MPVSVLSYATEGPGDTSDLVAKLSGFDLGKIRRVVLLGKVEGNAEANDFSRELALLATTSALERLGGEPLLAKATMLFSTGSEGALTPFGYLFIDSEASPEQAERQGGKATLALGFGRSRPIQAREVGTPDHVRLVADTVGSAMSEAWLTAEQVGLVVVKTPIMAHVTAADGQGVERKRISSHDSKAVGGLGAGVALGEIAPEQVTEARIGSDLSLYARRAMVFSGSEVDHVEVLLLGNRPDAGGDLAIYSTQLEHLLDAHAIRDLLTRAGCELDRYGAVTNPDRVRAMLLKVGFAPDGRILGRRTTILTSHLDPDQHLRATASGVVGAILGTTEFFVSADTVHQAPPGGGLAACVVRV